ncbi:hypothetical protein [Rhizobium sp. BK176]|uniref:hypothetical protein n=1 Tax=Rhizobium sp. BK176 TaxID=2587071 RepID=UPI002166C8A2|nr:hypothetical protein [Rhizobium sp. BK176]MCS4088859.1 hypothetical protein [Rhizobium sp. BK176]
MTEHAFEIPYVFKVIGTPSRGTKERSELAFETVQVKVSVVDIEDAPVAAAFNAPFGGDTYIGERGQVSLRAYEGRLYGKSLFEYNDATLGVTPDMLATFLERGIYEVENPLNLRHVLIDAPETLQRGLFPEKDDGNPIRPFDEKRWTRWMSPDRAEKRAKTEALWDSLIVIDGMFWRAVPQPVYVLDCHAEPSALIMSLPAATKRSRKDHIFGLAEWDRMIEASNEYWGSDPDVARATVFIEEHFAYDSSTEIFIELMSKAIDHDGDLLKSFDVDSMCRWAGMRDALGLARTLEFSSATLDALAASAEHYVCGPKASQHAQGLIAEALKLHDGQSIDIQVNHGRRP